MMHLHADTSMTSHTSSSIYSGSPTEENNKAWDNLILRKIPRSRSNGIVELIRMSALYFNASGSEVSSSFPGSVPEDYIKVVGWGYLASLEVYHQLHCLVSMLTVVCIGYTNAPRFRGSCVCGLSRRVFILLSPQLMPNFSKIILVR